VPTALDNGQRSPRKLLAAVVRRLRHRLRSSSVPPGTVCGVCGADQAERWFDVMDVPPGLTDEQRMHFVREHYDSRPIAARHMRCRACVEKEFGPLA